MVCMGKESRTKSYSLRFRDREGCFITVLVVLLDA